jgi:hypothetical protein
VCPFPVIEQLEPRPVDARGGYEPRRRGAEHELEQLAALRANLEPPALLVHGDHRALLEAAAEMRDARFRPDTGHRS